MEQLVTAHEDDLRRAAERDRLAADVRRARTSRTTMTSSGAIAISKRAFWARIIAEPLGELLIRAGCQHAGQTLCRSQ